MYSRRTVVIPTAKARTRTAGDAIPVIVPILLAVIQLILYLAIVGLEAASVYYDAGRGTIYAGFWCSLAFFVTWIAMFSFVCCKRVSACGTYLVVQNLVSAMFAVILIVFTALFINNPCLCYGIFCKVPSWDSISTIYDRPDLQARCTRRTYEKLPVLKGLLSCAVIMLASNLIFIAIYIISSILARKKPAPVTHGQLVEIPSYGSPGMNGYYSQYERPPLAATSSEQPYFVPTDEATYAWGVTNPPVDTLVVRF